MQTGPRDLRATRGREGATLKTVNVDALINEIAELTPRRTLKLETADETAEDKAAEATGR